MINPLDALLDLPEDRRTDLRFSWAWVTNVSPLRIQLDHETQPLVASPSSLTQVSVGDRVYTVTWGGRIVILGRKGGGGWQSWTPALTSSGNNVVMGNSTRVGRYVVREDGGVVFSGKITFGSTFNPGTGAHSLILPTPANVAGGLEWDARIYAVSSSVLGGNGEGIGYGKIEDSATVTRMFLRRNDSTASSLTRIDGDSPWAAGDRLVVSGTYEASL